MDETLAVQELQRARRVQQYADTQLPTQWVRAQQQGQQVTVLRQLRDDVDGACTIDTLARHVACATAVASSSEPHIDEEENGLTLC